MDRPKVALIHSELVIGGGPELITLQIIEALKDSYDVYLITYHRPNFEQLNAFYDTKISSKDIEILQISPPFFKKAAALGGYKLARFCQKKSSNFDLMFSVYNPMDFGVKGIQYIIDPNFNEQLLQILNPYPQKFKRWFYRNSLLRKAYLNLGAYLSNFSLERMKQNLSLVDSDWTGDLTKKFFGIETRTVYPPVPDKFPDIPWDKKKDGFICIGRITPDKKLDRVITILKEVREKGWDVHLHIIGSACNVEYRKYLEHVCHKNQEWIFIEGNIPGERKSGIIAEHKFGIHGKDNEPFGIAVGEMVNAGCIVWVPNGGGQVEIVRHPALIYHNEVDAVNKIESILQSQPLQVEMRDHLKTQSRKFSPARFRAEIREVVNQFLT